MAGASLGGIAQIFSNFSDLLAIGGSQRSVGLSIGSSSIKLVELQKVGKGWRLLHFGIVQLPEDVIVNREIANPISVVDNLKTLVSQIKLGTKNVCTSLSGTSLIIKRMTVDVPKLKDLQAQVFWEAEQYLPFDVSEVVMDFQMISRSKDNRTDVILVAVKKSVLDSYMACIEDSGLRAKIVDVDFFALQNLYEANYPLNPSEAVAIVDIGASSLKLAILHGGIPIFTKDSALGGRNLTAEIQKHLNLSYADAETLKMGGVAGTMPQEVSDLMHLMAENFGTEIKRGIDFYNASSSGAPVSCVLLAGGSARIPGLAKNVEDVVRVPTQLINPFNSISYDPAIFAPDYLQAIAPIAAIPIGLALRAGSA
ncbi:MAG TPA: type IV pilus assembly protein PilM [Bdellovibrionota bacterium]|nr:type IV pilus assembly protein PilM [Bdellovibrionota bacterium]